MKRLVESGDVRQIDLAGIRDENMAFAHRFVNDRPNVSVSLQFSKFGRLLFFKSDLGILVEKDGPQESLWQVRSRTFGQGDHREALQLMFQHIS